MNCGVSKIHAGQCVADADAGTVMQMYEFFRVFFFHVLSALFQYVSKAVIMNKEERIKKDEPLSAPTFH